MGVHPCLCRGVVSMYPPWDRDLRMYDAVKLRLEPPCAFGISFAGGSVVPILDLGRFFSVVPQSDLAHR